MGSGLGRTGDNLWAFQAHGVVPDILTVGKPLGNGHPLAAVICTKEISDKLGGYFSTFGGNPVACAMGLAVLDVVHNEKLMSSAKSVGRLLGMGLNDIKVNKKPRADHRQLSFISMWLHFKSNEHNLNPA